MKSALLLLVLLLPLEAQIGKPASAGRSGPDVLFPGAPPRPMKIARGTFTDLEKRFDSMLAAVNPNDPIDPLGNMRGVYLEGYGVVLTSELSLVRTPTINPFNQTITKESVVRVHQRKLDQLPALRKTMVEMMKAAALTLVQIPDNQHIVLIVRLDYLSWEDTSKLPGQLEIRADRKSALAGNLVLEEN